MSNIYSARSIAQHVPYIASRKASLNSYKPFILAVLLVVALTAALSMILGHGRLARFPQTMSLFMGFFYVVFALPKLGSIRGFSESFAAYDVIAKHVPFYSYLYPFVELLLGSILLINNRMSNMLVSRVIAVCIIFVSTVGIIGVSSALRQKKKLECACLGSAFSFPLSKLSLVENGLMLVMVVAMLFLPMSAAQSNPKNSTKPPLIEQMHAM